MSSNNSIHHDREPRTRSDSAAAPSGGELRVLILMLENWRPTPRLAKPMHEAGFKVAALCSPGNWLSKTRYVDEVLTFPEGAARGVMKSLGRGLRKIAPGLVEMATKDPGSMVRRNLETPPSSARIVESLVAAMRRPERTLLICGDELARRFLNHLVRVSEQGGPGAAGLPADVLARLRFSFGPPDFYDAANRKSALYELAHRTGVRQPCPEPVSTIDDIDRFAGHSGYPLVLKRDFTSGGDGVAICHDRGEAHAALARLQKLGPEAESVVRLAENGSGPKFLEDEARITAHKFIRGDTALCGVAALEGRLLASFTATKLEVRWDNGPSSVVRFARNQEMEEAAARLIAAIGFTGIGEVEFMIEDGTGHAYLCEFNPRPAPTSHLGGLVGADLCRALHDGLAGNLRAGSQPLSTQGERVVALFPQEWIRDPSSEWLLRAWHDVPWDDPPLLEALIRDGISAGRRDFRAPRP
jgi:hypothetical protein